MTEFTIEDAMRNKGRVPENGLLVLPFAEVTSKVTVSCAYNGDILQKLQEKGSRAVVIQIK